MANAYYKCQDGKTITVPFDENLWWGYTGWVQSNGGLYALHGNPYSPSSVQPLRSLFFGWSRDQFHECCGMQQVHGMQMYEYRYKNFDPEIWEAWYNDEVNINAKPIMGVLAVRILKDGSLENRGPITAFLRSKGTCIAGYKNQLYENSWLEVHVFLHPKSLLRNQVFGIVPFSPGYNK